MPKMKTNKSIAKRFRRNGSGRIVRTTANRRHILTKKSTARKRRLRVASPIVVGGEAKRLKRMAPYL